MEVNRRDGLEELERIVQIVLNRRRASCMA
jgi:hypothetical protein